MSLTDQEMRFKSMIWHTANNTLEITLQSTELPPPPEWVEDENMWYGLGGDQVTFTVPVSKKAGQAPATAIARTGLNPDGTPSYTRYTWSAATQTWINPVPCDHNGNPL